MIFEKNIKYFSDEKIEKFNKLNVAVVGAGGTGIPVCQLLVSLGVFNITVFDYDKIELSNLNRQFMYNENEVGKQKVQVLSEKLSKRHSQLKIQSENIKIDENNIKILLNYDFIFDCTDSFKTKFMLNDFCINNKILLAHSGVNLDSGQAGIINYQTGGCLRCFIKSPIEQKENINVAHNVMLAATLQVEEFVNFFEQDYNPGIVFFKTKPDIFICKIKFSENCSFCGGFKIGNKA